MPFILKKGETNNITKSLDYTSDAQLTKTLKEYNIPSKDFEKMLKNISNNGASESWQNYIRAIPNTGYIKNLVENDSFKFISNQDINSPLSQPVVSITNENDIVNYLKNDDFLSIRFIDLNYNGVSYSSIKDLQENNKNMVIKTDFDSFGNNPPLDHHPSKLCHQVIAENIIKNIEKDLI